MTVDELRTLAEDADESVVLVIPPPPSRGHRIRLCRTSGPLGTINCVNRDGNTVAVFRAKDILAWCDKYKL